MVVRNRHCPHIGFPPSRPRPPREDQNGLPGGRQWLSWLLASTGVCLLLASVVPPLFRDAVSALFCGWQSSPMRSERKPSIRALASEGLKLGFRYPVLVYRTTT